MGAIELQYYLQSITERSALEQCFHNHTIDIVFLRQHKHVFMTEAIPKAAIINNILGTKNVVDVA